MVVACGWCRCCTIGCARVRLSSSRSPLLVHVTHDRCVIIRPLIIRPLHTSRSKLPSSIHHSIHPMHCNHCNHCIPSQARAMGQCRAKASGTAAFPAKGQCGTARAQAARVGALRSAASVDFAPWMVLSVVVCRAASTMPHERCPYLAFVHPLSHHHSHRHAAHVTPHPLHSFLHADTHLRAGRGAWSRIHDTVARDLKTRDKFGAAGFTAGVVATGVGAAHAAGGSSKSLTAVAAAAAASSSSSSGTAAAVATQPLDWHKLCVDIAIQQEDDAELAAKGNRAGGSAAGGGLLGASKRRRGRGLSIVDGLIGSHADNGTGAASEGRHRGDSQEWHENSTADESLDRDVDADHDDDDHAADAAIDIPADAVLMPTGPAAARLIAGAASQQRAGGLPGGQPPQPGAPAAATSGAAASSAPGSHRGSGLRVSRHAYHPAEAVAKPAERYAGEPIAGECMLLAAVV